MSAPRRHSASGTGKGRHDRGRPPRPTAGSGDTTGRAQHATRLGRPDRGDDGLTLRRIKRSGLPPDKTLPSLVRRALPRDVRRQIPALCRGDFVRRHHNVIAIGPSATGKTHLLCAIGRELIARGFTVLFVPAHRLLDRLLVAEQALDLERELRRLDACDVVLLDDIGAVPQRPEHGRLLLALVARRYERRSTMVTSSLPFARWDQIFHDSAIASAALDRLVHHATILQLPGRSYRGPRRARGPLPHEGCYRRSGVASSGLLPSTAAQADPEASR
jgi:DNA replication protein DnaC